MLSKKKVLPYTDTFIFPPDSFAKCGRKLYSSNEESTCESEFVEETHSGKHPSKTDEVPLPSFTPNIITTMSSR